jgi:rod shape-determining protein MreC
VAVYRRSARPRFTLLLLVLTAITLLTLDERGSRAVGAVRGYARDAFAPVASAADRVFGPVADAVQGVVHYGDLEAENHRLREQLAEQQGEQLRAQDAQRELKALADLQNLDFVGDTPTVAARVVSTSPNNFQLTLEIDRGTRHGVARGMPVVSGAGLVGRIVDASRTRSVVLLVTDQESSVGVRLATSGDVGVATGRGMRAPLEVDLIDPATVVPEGEVVVTSGLQQSVFPPGIPVGKVRTAKAAPGALQQDVAIDPVVDLRRLTFVKVLQWSSRPS